MGTLPDRLWSTAGEVPGGSERARWPEEVRFKNKVMSLDGSIIDLSASMSDWAK
jgi:hypothetical protein